LQSTKAGGIHLLDGLYDAKIGQPVLALTGLQFHDLIGTKAQQDVELDKLYEKGPHLTRGSWVSRTSRTWSIWTRIALSYRGVAHITFPGRLAGAGTFRKQASKRNLRHYTSDVCARSARLPSTEDLRAAAEVLNGGEKVAIRAGQVALDAGAQLGIMDVDDGFWPQVQWVALRQLQTCGTPVTWRFLNRQRSVSSVSGS
jgi:pyruvate dehydrogenase (quinone)